MVAARAEPAADAYRDRHPHVVKLMRGQPLALGGLHGPRVLRGDVSHHRPGRLLRLSREVLVAHAVGVVVGAVRVEEHR